MQRCVSTYRTWTRQIQSFLVGCKQFRLFFQAFNRHSSPFFLLDATYSHTEQAAPSCRSPQTLIPPTPKIETMYIIPKLKYNTGDLYRQGSESTFGDAIQSSFSTAVCRLSCGQYPFKEDFGKSRILCLRQILIRRLKHLTGTHTISIGIKGFFPFRA